MTKTVRQQIKVKTINKTDTMNKYERQAQDFLDKTNSTLEIKFNGMSNRFGDITTFEFEFTIQRGCRSYTALYNSSLNDLHEFLEFDKRNINPNCLLAGQIVSDLIYQLEHGRKKIIMHMQAGGVFNKNVDKIPKPSNYDILSCIQGYDVGTLQDFIDEYGCDTSDIERTISTYEALKRENEAMKMLYSDIELEKLNEIN